MKLITACIDEQLSKDVDKRYEQAFKENQEKVEAVKDRVRKRRKGRPVSRQLVKGAPTDAAPSPIERMEILKKQTEEMRKELRTAQNQCQAIVNQCKHFLCQN